MSKRVEEAEHEGNSERWLLTYADMITLLLALFIMLYAMSNVDAEKYKAVAAAMGAAFNNPPIEGSGTGSTSASGTTGSAAGGNTGGNMASNLNMSQLYEQLNAYVKGAGLENQIDVAGTSDFVAINLKDSVLFVPDSSQMLPGGEPILTSIEKLLEAAYVQIGHITIRGHTAYIAGQDSPQSEEFGWTLSAERALKVLNAFTTNGMPPNKFSIEGYSHYAPIASNDTEDGRSKNRRVEIYITK